LCSEGLETRPLPDFRTHSGSSCIEQNKIKIFQQQSFSNQINEEDTLTKKSADVKLRKSQDVRTTGLSELIERKFNNSIDEGITLLLEYLNLIPYDSKLASFECRGISHSFVFSINWLSITDVNFSRQISFVDCCLFPGPSFQVQGNDEFWVISE
jgi:hypothetical protein